MIAFPINDRRAYERLRELLPELLEAMGDLIRHGHTPEQIVAVLASDGTIDAVSSEGREAHRLIMGAAQHIHALEHPRIAN